MTDSLFFLGDDKSLKITTSAGFVSEDEFQEILERFPALLTDADFGENTARRWMLVRREAGIADRDGAGARWSLDHLFLDQDGVPTLVEVKRATDTRARREVVAQMLDYAANSIRRWSLDELSQWFLETCAKVGVSPTDRLSELLQVDNPDFEAYWRGVEANLRGGRIRMVFVADKILPELQGIVEFLNEQMNPATIAAIELRPFSNGRERILVPRLIGTTRLAVEKKSVPRALQAQSVEEWFNKTFKGEHAIKRRIVKLLDALNALGCRESVVGKSLALDFSGGKETTRVAYIRDNGKCAVSAYMLAKEVQFESDASRMDLLNKLGAIGFELSSKVVSGEPSFTLPEFEDEASWTALIEFFSQLFEQLKSNRLVGVP